MRLFQILLNWRVYETEPNFNFRFVRTQSLGVKNSHSKKEITLLIGVNWNTMTLLTMDVIFMGGLYQGVKKPLIKQFVQYLSKNKWQLFTWSWLLFAWKTSFLHNTEKSIQIFDGIDNDSITHKNSKT